ncbi:MAG TPA: hypothetical protein VMQ40_02580 [Acidimicrobiales bacterium]|nr:hypothetical protein [Acidimicrobiales bacterium]
MDAVEDTTEFADPGARRSKALFCLLGAGVLVLLFRQMSVHAQSIVLVYMGVVGVVIVVMLIGMVRSLRIGIYLTPDDIVVRTTFSTRSWRWGELERVTTIDIPSRGGFMSLAAPTKRIEPRVLIIPVFRPIGRHPVVVRGLHVVTSSPADANWLDDALREVNQAIEEHRGVPGADAAPPTPS